MRRFLFILTVLCLVTWGTVLYLLFERRDQATAALPTLMVLPSLTPSDTPTRTPLATDTPTTTATLTGDADTDLHPNGKRNLHANADPDTLDAGG